MRRIWIAALWGTVILQQPLNGQGTTALPAEPRIEHPAFAGDLVQALMFGAEKFGVTVVAELAQPYPDNVSIPAGSDDALGFVNLAIRGSRHYRAEKRDSVYWVYDSRLEKTPGNYLNGEIREFRTPATLGAFEDNFPMYISVAQGRGGGLLGGLRYPADDTLKLAPGTLKNSTLREVVFYVARQGPKLFALFVFPDSNLRSWREADQATVVLGSIQSVAANPPVLRSLPASKGAPE